MATTTASPSDGGEIYIEADRVKDQIDGERDVHPTNHTMIASYNFNIDNTSLVVPGHPRILAPGKVKERFCLTKGTHHQIQDDNQYQTGNDLREKAVGTHELTNGEALTEAVNLCSPEFDYESVDFIADVGILNKLLHIICGRPRNSEGMPSTTRFGDAGGFKFLIYDAQENLRENQGRHGKEGYITPTIVLTRAGEDMDREDFAHKKEKIDNCYFTQYRHWVTAREAGHPADAKNKLFLVQQVELDNLNLLVQSKVHAVERAGFASSREEGTTVEHGPTTRSSCSSGMHDTPVARKSGTMLGAEDNIVELLTCNSRFVERIDWQRNHWHLALVGGDKLIIGLHNRGMFNVGRINKALELSACEVESRAAKEEGSLTMVYFANALREISRAAQVLLPNCRPTKVDGRLRKVAILDFRCDTGPHGGTRMRKRIRVRPYDG